MRRKIWKTEDDIFGKYTEETASTYCNPRSSGLCLLHLFHVGEDSQDVCFSHGQLIRMGHPNKVIQDVFNTG